MPLPPSGNTPWPPPRLEIPHADMDMWRAWYAGDTGHLAQVYGGPASYTRNGVARAFFDVDKRRAVGGDELRMFWGQDPSPGQQAAKLHIPIGGDIAEMSANLLWAEVPQVTVDVDSTDKATAESTQAQIGRYLDDRGHAKMREAAELTAGLSNVYLRAVWDTSLRPRPWSDVIQANAVVPEWRWGMLAAATVWRDLEPLDDAGGVWRLLEYHTPGLIEYGVYKGDHSTLGMLMEFTDHHETEFLASRTDDKGRQATGVDRLLITHLPNVLPNRLWDGVPDTAPLGRSDYAGIEPMMDALDESWTSWMRDLRLGKAKVVVPQSMLDTDGPGTGGTFDLDKELIVALSGLLGAETMKDSISEVQFKIRVEEHEATTKALRRQILASARLLRPVVWGGGFGGGDRYRGRGPQGRVPHDPRPEDPLSAASTAGAPDDLDVGRREALRGEGCGSGGGVDRVVAAGGAAGPGGHRAHLVAAGVGGGDQYVHEGEDAGAVVG
ncbi:hypothetical protein ABXI76_05265 [Streptomyces parvus]